MRPAFLVGIMFGLIKGRGQFEWAYNWEFFLGQGSGGAVST